jgi:hypothetical protein
MTNSLDLQDLSIVLAIGNYNPSMVNADLLKASGIIPNDWQLARPAALSNRSTQLIFQNGVKIEAQIGNISFSENMGGDKPLAQMEIPHIARQYATKLPNLDYQGVGINPREFITFDDEQENAHQYLTHRLLASGAWQKFGTAPLQAGINLVYTLEQGQLRLGINEAKLNVKKPDQDQEFSAIVFAGNFHYNLTGASTQDKLQSLHQVLDHWQSNVSAFRDLIHNQFLLGVNHNSHLQSA